MGPATDEASEELWCIELCPALSDVTITEEALSAMGYVCSSWVNIETHRAVLRVFACDRTDARAAASRMANDLPSWENVFENVPPSPRVRALQRQDWAECWKDHFHTFRASRRIVVKPSWEHHDSAPDDLVLELDPGMCFGTGYHGTTRACLIFLDDLAETLGPVSLLDVGCGSGILSLGAAALGYRPIYGFDIDENAVRVARENLAKAGCSDIQVQAADMRSYQPVQRCRVVVANVLAHVLCRHCRRLLDWVDADGGPGHLLLAGILSEQYADIRRRFADRGAVEVRQLTIDEWTSGCFRVDGAPD